MKNVIILLLAAVFCFSCSYDSKEEKTLEFKCNATYYHYLIGRNDKRCQFYFFPNGNYTKVVRNTAFEVDSLPWNAYAVTSTGEVVYSVMQANYTKGDWATPYAVNGYGGSTTQGTFYVVAFPYSIRTSNGKYAMYNCYKAKSFQKEDNSESCLIMPMFNYEIDDYDWFDGEKSEPVKLDWE